MAGGYTIKHIPGVGGPFNTAAEYFQAWADVMLRDPERESRPNPSFPIRVKAMADELSQENHGPFALYHPDFGNHNFIVDDDYNIIGLIDWGDTWILPVEFCEIFPQCLTFLNEIFWKGSRFEKQNVAELLVVATKRQVYVNAMRSKEPTILGSTFPDRLGSIHTEAAQCLCMYSQRSQNPLGKVFDLLEKDNQRQDQSM